MICVCTTVFADEVLHTVKCIKHLRRCVLRVQCVEGGHVVLFVRWYLAAQCRIFSQGLWGLQNWGQGWGCGCEWGNNHVLSDERVPRLN